MKGHTHLSDEVYKKVKTIKFITLQNSLVMDIMEILAINIYQPRYNTANLYDLDEITPELKDMYDKYIQPIDEWKELPSEIFSFSERFVKKTKPETPAKTFKERQREGIQRAKELGKYKGRKTMQIDEDKFKQMLIEWKNKERTAVSIQREFHISAQTFYRWIKEDRYII
jgi:hypothetical protein